ncbi:MAG: indole-3-glycerol phosphate synthase TrpC [Kiritimatiellia bacterium]|jgi:indole-3-glycerol phosphate synthase
MESFLQTVTEERRKDAEAASASKPLEVLQTRVAAMTGRRSLLDRLRRVSKSEACIVAQIKRASPSVGLLRADCDPKQIAGVYEKAGAGAVAVVTEPRHFQGQSSDIAAARAATDLPIMRKDFYSVPYQVYETAALGADVILLVAACLDFNQLRDLYIVALAIGLEVVVEVHTADELEMALPLADAAIGVNNRNLRTMKTDLNVCRELIHMIPPGRLAMAESGINTRRDVKELRELGYRGFLIGEALMRSANPGLRLRMLLGHIPRSRHQT